MISMGEPNNIVSLADWKAARERKQDQPHAVPVYVPVRDPDGRWGLKLVGHTELDAEFRINPSSTR